MARVRLSSMATAAHLDYHVSAAMVYAHLFEVTLHIPHPQANQMVSLPVWIPGSYLVREFAKHLQLLKASQRNTDVAIQQIDKCTWQVRCAAGKPLELTYQVYALDASVRTAWLDAQRAFFNGTSLCLRVHGQEELPHHLTLSADGVATDWQAVTALAPFKINGRGFGTYLAANYDELVDSPVEMGAFWSGSFTACGIKHRFVVSGATASFDGARLLADTKAICEAEIGFWHGKYGQPPHSHYLFMLNAVDNSYGGLEHRNSTALICKRADLPRVDQPKATGASDGYTTLLGLISHEYFHTWNVKRLRPAEFARYDYGQENYTQMLWFFEGFTSYFDDLLLRRAGLIDDATYLTLLCKTINQVMQTPGRQVQSVAQASFDAWVKYYRQDENTGNATISYYTKGALVALCLDLSLRQSGKASLDDAMRSLWQRCQGGPMTEADLLAVVTELVGGEAVAKRLSQWVHSTTELPLKALLTRHGVNWQQEPAPLADQLGLRVTESTGICIKSVLRDSAAESAGFAAGDEWLGVELGTAKARQGWRLNKLGDLSLILGAATTFDTLIARDQRLMTLHVTLPANIKQVKLSVQDASLAQSWLAAKLSKTISKQ
jgi:predicted metalloprotease with PDZ domain